MNFPLAIHCRTCLLFILMVATGLPACRKFIDVPPPATQIVSADVFSTDQSASMALSDLYSSMMAGFGPMNGFMSKYGGLYSDELLKTGMNSSDSFYQLSSIPAGGIL